MSAIYILRKHERTSWNRKRKRNGEIINPSFLEQRISKRFIVLNVCSKVDGKMCREFWQLANVITVVASLHWLGLNLSPVSHYSFSQLSSNCPRNRSSVQLLYLLLNSFRKHLIYNEKKFEKVSVLNAHVNAFKSFQIKNCFPTPFQTRTCKSETAAPFPH